MPGSRSGGKALGSRDQPSASAAARARSRSPESRRSSRAGAASRRAAALRVPARPSAKTAALLTSIGRRASVATAISVSIAAPSGCRPSTQASRRRRSVPGGRRRPEQAWVRPSHPSGPGPRSRQLALSRRRRAGACRARSGRVGHPVDRARLSPRAVRLPSLTAPPRVSSTEPPSSGRGDP